MSVRVGERPNSRQISQKPPRALREYVVSGTHDELYALSLVMGYAPGIISSVDSILYRQDIQIVEAGHKVWNASVPYAEKEKENGSFTFSFDTTGGTVRARTSRSTVARYPNDAANHNQLVNVKKDGDVEGADIVIPALKIQIDFTYPNGFVTISQVKNWARITGCVNENSFLGFAGGEVLYLGVTGSAGSNSPLTVGHQFACSQNATGLTIGSISGIAKDGHDLIWVSYEDYTDGGKPAVRPKAAYVERMYQRIDLAAALGFGG